MLKKTLLLTFLICPSLWSFTYDQHGILGLDYGPNISWTFAGNTPISFGQWLPQFTGSLDYNWIEPLGERLPYGEEIGFREAFLRFQASIQTSPFYGGFMVGMGLRPFKTNPQVEVRFLYQSTIYYNSNIEMVLADSTGGGSISDSWNADYVLDHVWSQEFSRVDFSQNFNVWVDFDFAFRSGSIMGLGGHFTLTDIQTKHDNKSYDYERNLPVFSRDYIFELIFFHHIHLSDKWNFVYYLNGYQTGFLRNDDGTILKESLSYGKIMAGINFQSENKLRSFTVTPGFWFRPKKGQYNGTLLQQFLIHLQYQGHFSFPFRSRK
jgi:hypothetical protein